MAAFMVALVVVAVLVLESVKSGGSRNTTMTKYTETSLPLAASTKAPEDARPAEGSTVDAAAEPTMTAREFTEYLAGESSFTGPEDAPVIIVEFSDYMCPFCGKFFLETLPLILETCPDEVKFVHKDFLNFGDTSLAVAMSEHCAKEQDKYDEMQAVYFGKFADFDFENFHHGPGEGDPGDQDWQTEFKKGYEEEEIYAFAGEAGLDLEELSVCMENQPYSEEILYDYAIAQQLGISGIPCFVINGMGVSGTQPFEVFQEVIEEALSAQ